MLTTSFPFIGLQIFRKSCRFCTRQGRVAAKRAGRTPSSTLPSPWNFRMCPAGASIRKYTPTSRGRIAELSFESLGGNRTQHHFHR